MAALKEAPDLLPETPEMHNQH